MANREIISRWADALESGEYRQGHYRLRSKDNYYCCLGVLCDLASRDGVIPAPNLTAISGGEVAYEYEGLITMPPARVCRWAGLNPNPQSVSWERLTNLATINDLSSGFGPSIECIRGLWLETEDDVHA